MKFRVKTLRRAERQYTGFLSYIAERSKAGATAWARAFDAALARLEISAGTFPLAAESDLVEMEVREILFKTRRGLVYRLLFTIRGRDVLVLHLRGPGQDLLQSNQMDPEFND
jgi:plasmid stabilization system protein ParE